ncbi:cell division protein FtsQ/DivIB [Novosphingobium sp. JCM 18896]|uniref:cell division protein FtsQ/DivIB n=1 Tax=Novosphingobium sp. JCM 18896 TaxID=2989731 RepID=UPI002222333A|nr:cell division protein FtsQ/DivIB [Novosphingobium sp. JCM 18896]MCW1430529.1 FtsQ-type POTRA domain-containing protein [Novosphingobium sp. JCM 18896]
MTTQTLKRKAPTARKVAARQGTAQKVRAAKATTGSAYDGFLSWLPFSEEQLHRILLAMILGGAAVLAWVVAGFAGLPAMAGQQLAMIAGDAGFEVRRVDVRGVKNLNELKIYERVLAERNRAMPLVDIDALRQELIQLSWVKDARVSRQLPDTLVIDVVERVPHAVLKKPGNRLALIDSEGNELETVSAARAKGLLMVGGPGASKQVVALSALLEAAPALQPQVREAEWIGNRRWNLKFKTGQVLALPEGGQASAKALMAFARLDGTNRLLGGKVAAFDMRAPDRIYLRVPDRAKDEADAKVAAAVAKTAAVDKPKQDKPKAAKEESE